MINIVFLKEGEPIASYGVDKNGVYCLDAKIENYKLKSDSLNYDRILEIYDESKNEN
ncbi:NOGCT domain-containing protein [Tissierella sp. P1]|uniref:NOGCT domain-containing protein n=1 Tax=Tissierella sp. P1 TaxID=1280483 RepID=UPI0013031C3E|nr:NOGCT domain-containing protein [Tissierella sp. P1]